MIEDLLTPTHLLIILVLVVFFFGSTRLPQLGRSIGSGIREFRSGIAGLHESDETDAPTSRIEPPTTVVVGVEDQRTASQADGEPEPAEEELLEGEIVS
jgi:sec-independent protein translocase protein TatA